MKLLLLLLLSTLSLMIVNAAHAAKINPDRDLYYLGAFKVPNVTWKSSYGAMSWGQRGLTFFPKGNSGAGSLYITAKANLWGIAEISIPTLINDFPNNRISALNIASLLQPFIDPTMDNNGNSRVPIGIGDCYLDAIQYFPALGTQTSPKIYWSFNNYYNPPSNLKTMGWCELDLSNSSTLSSQGVFQLGENSITTNQYFFEIPKSWANTYIGGKYLASGRFRVTGGAFGPPIFASAPWSAGTSPPDGTIISTTPLLFYSTGHVPTGYNHSMADLWFGGAWLEGPNNKSAVIIVGTKGFREATSGSNQGTTSSNHLEYYDNGTAANSMLPDTSSTGHGYHADPYLPAILFYDPDDFAAVAKGTKQPYEPQPYTIWYPNHLLYHKNRGDTEIFGGVAYDRYRNRLYIIEKNANNIDYHYDPGPVIHVWEIQDNGGSMDTTKPSAPQNLIWDSTTNTLSWTASSAGNKKLFYIIYRNLNAHGSSPGGYEPVALSQSDRWVDSWYNDYDPSNYSRNNAIRPDGTSRGKGAYKALAMDELGNKSDLSSASDSMDKQADKPNSPTHIRISE